MSSDPTTDIVDLVVFTVNDVMCAFGVDEVQEIKRVVHITPVHRAPEYVRGVINLRGQIVTVIDLRKKLNYHPVEINDLSRIVVVCRGGEQIGLLVDTIEDAVAAEKQEILIPPSNIHGAEKRFFRGVYKTPDSLVAILDKEALLEKEKSIQGTPGSIT